MHRQTGERLPLTAAQFAALCELTVANWLEQRPRAPEAYQFLRRDDFYAMRRHLRPKVRAALDEADGFTTE